MQDRWNAVTALADPSRRALYDHVRHQDHPVTREEAAYATGVSRNLAAFHLDKLVDAGLLLTRFEVPDGQPRGRGRTPKVYLPADDGLAVTIPERRYELIAEILADAVAEHPDDAEESARRVAYQRGQSVGARLRGRAVLDVLAELGFEPAGGNEEPIILANCPFHLLAVRQTDLVCGLNHAFLGGVLAGLERDALRAYLVPRPGGCCVQLAPTDPPPATGEHSPGE